jgi:2-amino-4-hydroxy-6-hydroxymethyldihydropteridine diphosphokinase
MKEASSPRDVLLALGANLDRPLERLREAVARLATELDEVRVSAVYRTPSEGSADQADYVNAVVRGRTSCTPRELLELAHLLEAEQGRVRPYPGAPRTLDVDVLFVGDLTVNEPGLTIPHPRWASRDFVVVPLLDVAPEWIDPVTGDAVADVARTRGWDDRRFPRVERPGALLPLEVT